MSPTCDHCGGPVTAPHPGRPWPGRPPASYCCYGCLSLGEQDRQLDSAPAPGWKLDGLGVRLGASVVIVAQSMAFGLAVNLHDDIPGGVRFAVQSVILVGTLAVVALLGGPLARAAWAELRRGRLTIEALFLLTAAGALAASVQAHFTGRGKIYFEVVSILLVVYTLGKIIGARARAAALAAGRAWAGQLSSCRVLDEKGQPRTASVGEVRPGDVVEVWPGETVAVDGVVAEGTGFVSEAAVTGEPFPVVRRPGDRVLAGSASHDATFHVTATARGTERHVDKLLAAVAAARNAPLSAQAQADRLGRWFFPLVVATAAGTFVYWAWVAAAGWETALFHAMSVLLVACPCVIGLATPIIVWSALGRLAERGLIARGGDVVERLAAVDRVVFDKTGTLTEDRFALLDVVTAGAFDRPALLGWLAAVQEQSKHPVARPFAELPRSGETRVAELRVAPGCGVEAVFAEPGGTHTLRVGRPEWVAPGDPPAFRELVGRLLAPPARLVAVEVDGGLAAVAAVEERVRDTAADAVAEFQAAGIPVEVLTGDSADRVGLAPARTGLLPDDKRARVAELKAAGFRPLVVGDGINDAAALAEAHVGVALASGADLAVGASDATLYGGDLRVLPWAVALSRAAVRAVRRNLLRAVAFNLVGMGLAAGGVLHPVAAVLLMVVSSLSLVVSSVRVGVAPVCLAVPGGGSGWKAAVHALALAGQGVLVLLLLESARESGIAAAVLGGFAAAGVGVAAWWRRTRSHAADMTVGMLTAGNFGMLLGWWADAGFDPLADRGCACCAANLADALTRPWMWVGMLAFSNAAMVWLTRTPAAGRHRAAMFTGGNAGMAAGMWAGGWAAGTIAAGSVAGGFALHLAGMTAGMVVGMLIGTRVAEGVPWPRRGGVKPRSSRRQAPPPQIPVVAPSTKLP